MLSASQILDAAQTFIADQSAPTRAKMLSWLGDLMQKVAIETDWFFLMSVKNDASVTGGVVTFPIDFQRFLYLTDGSNWGFGTGANLTDDEAARLDVGYGGSTPVGYTLNDITSMNVKPAPTDGTVSLKYVRAVPEPADTADATLWPDIFRPLFVRGVIQAYYEFDTDPRAMPSYKLDEAMLIKCRKWNNKHLPTPKKSKYMRD